MANPRFFVTSKSLLLRAEQCRRLGNGMREGVTRNQMLETAIYYQQLAKEVQRRQISGRTRQSK